ncbi:MAG: phosphoenolpyruvate--protein phosphotransferase [Candidatus Njordarchaeales archaeon]
MKKVLKGSGVYPDIGIGEAIVLRKYEIDDLVNMLRGTKVSLEDFERALEAAKNEISELMTRLEKVAGKDVLELMEFQLMILEEDSFTGRIRELIKEGIHPADAIKQVMEEVSEIFRRSESVYMRQRVSDIQDLCIRLLKKLAGLEETEVKKKGIIIAPELHPSEVLYLADKMVGLVTQYGTALSHFAIIARSLRIPTVVKVKDALREIRDGDVLVVNGLNGTVIINPPEKELEEIKRAKEEWSKLLHEIIEKTKEPAIMKDGETRVFVVANIGKEDEAETAAHYGAEGIGLFRTEFYFLGRNEPPSEDEQFRAYKFVAQRLSPHLVIIRTLDIGSDKPIPYIPMHHEPNPALGKRAIRLYWKELCEIIRAQFRAILRAANHGNVGIMLPMVADVTEVIKAREFLEELINELKKEGVSFGNVKYGIMVEIPSAALLAEKFANYVDFMSIGTNDLTQYTLAIDRAGLECPEFFDHLHPAVLKLIKNVVEATKNTNVEVSVCGESASDIYAVPVLIGLGVRKLSVTPSMIPIIKHVIRQLSPEEVEKLAEEALRASTPQEVRAIVKEFYDKKGLRLPIM